MNTTNAHKIASDADLAREAQAGGREAFSLLVSRYRQAVYGLCYHRLRSFEDAQDATQEAFTRAYAALETLQQPAWFGTWLYRIASNVCGMWQRRAAHPTVSLEECEVTAAEAEQPEVAADQKERHEAVLTALDHLSEQDRLVLTLFYFDGCSHAQIAALLGVPAQTVKSRLHEARQRLKSEVIDGFVRVISSQPLPQDFQERVLHACGCTESDCACVRRVRLLNGSSRARPQRVRRVALGE